MWPKQERSSKYKVPEWRLYAYSLHFFWCNGGRTVQDGFIKDRCSRDPYRLLFYRALVVVNRMNDNGKFIFISPVIRFFDLDDLLVAA